MAEQTRATNPRAMSLIDALFLNFKSEVLVVNRWDEKAGPRRDAVRSQVIDVLEAQEIKETGNEEG